VRAPDPQVAQLQRWMQHVCTHPRGVAHALTTAESKAEYELKVDELERLVAPSKALSGLDRISIYAEMYVLRLLDVLREDFPVLMHALGPQRFEGLARAYIAAHPSRHYNLNQFGRHMSTFLATRDDKHAAFFAELAELERAATESFDAARADALGRAELEALKPEQWPALALRLVPSARVLAFRHPVNRYYVDVREGRKARIPKVGASWTLVYRKDWIVWRAQLSREQHALLEALAGGATLGRALEKCAARTELDAAKLQQGLAPWFREWSAEGIFRSLR
jgi:hypothetical protein